MLLSIVFLSKISLALSLPEGSPISVVPPPTKAIDL